MLLYNNDEYIKESIQGCMEVTEKPKSDSLTLYIVIGICVIVVIALIVVFYVLKRKSKKELPKVSEPAEVVVENVSNEAAPAENPSS